MISGEWQKVTQKSLLQQKIYDAEMSPKHWLTEQKSVNENVHEQLDLL